MYTHMYYIMYLYYVKYLFPYIYVYSLVQFTSKFFRCPVR
jgi:hypothetical protein